MPPAYAFYLCETVTKMCIIYLQIVCKRTMCMTGNNVKNVKKEKSGQEYRSKQSLSMPR